MNWVKLYVGSLALALVPVMVSERSSAEQAADPAALEKQRCPKPREFALVFSFGYAGDHLPREPERFDALLGKIKEAGFNTVHCTYTEARVEACKKHGIRMMVDLLSVEHHHVYKSPDKARAVCEKLRNHPQVWGYNIWNDPMRKTGEGRRRDVNSVRQWDPTHPAYCGTYRTEGMRHITNGDIIGYYDFHWKRGKEQLFPHLLQFSQWAKERDAYFYRWLEVDAGLAGKGNFNRCLHSVSTSTACGAKGVLWFLGTELMDPKTLEWTAHGQDIIKVQREFGLLGPEVARLGNPVAIHTTFVTRTLDDKPLPDGKAKMLPPGLEKHAFPADSFLQPVQGEFVAGFYRDADNRDHVFLANHNAYVEQEVRLKPAAGLKAWLLDRSTGKWQPLEPRDGQFQLRLPPAGGELLRFEK